MGDLIELMMDLGEFKKKYGVKGACCWRWGRRLIGAIIAAAYWVQ